MGRRGDWWSRFLGDGFGNDVTFACSLDAKKEHTDDLDKATKPGEEGWIPRATVPKPSNKDYIIRPDWRVGDMKRQFDDGDDEDDDGGMTRGGGGGGGGPPKKRSKQSGSANNPANWEKTFRKIREAGKQRKMIQRAANISIQGRGLGV